jgi:hypothetical protein
LEAKGVGFEHCTHGPTVEDVDGTIATMVDTAEHKVRPTGAEMLES